MTTTYRIAILGFSPFERTTLASYFRLATHRTPCYEQVLILEDSDFIVADADHAPSVQLVVATDRLAEAVFIGAQPPEATTAWMPRPIDPLHVIRELDAMAALGSARQRPGSKTPAAAVASPGEPAAAAAAPPDTPQRPRPSALLVDDSEIALRFLESRLQVWGLRIDRASDSATAIGLLARQDYDFVFLDVELGEDSEQDGLGLCQHIKRLDHGGAAITSVVVLVSAHVDELDRVRGALAGCDAHLGKPLNEIELHRLMLRHGLQPVPAPEGAGPA
jgi:CheY-like chemotaxis protein